MVHTISVTSGESMGVAIVFLFIIVSLIPFVIVGLITWAVIKWLSRKQERDPGIIYSSPVQYVQQQQQPGAIIHTSPVVPSPVAYAAPR